MSKPRLTQKLRNDLAWAAKQPGRTHHDGGLTLSPLDARDLLAVIEALEWYAENPVEKALADWWEAGNG